MARGVFKKMSLSFIMLTLLVAGLVTFVARRAAREDQLRITANGGAGGRSPASIQKVFDYSYLDGDSLKWAAKKRVIESIDFGTQADEARVNLGNFVLLDEANHKDFACGYYDRIEISFEAEGVAISGDKPSILVTTGCEVGPNINNLMPIRIPVGRLRAEKPGNSEYKFFDSSQPVTISLNNAPDVWPDRWIMTDVRLINSQKGSRILHVNQDEIRQITGHTMMMKW